MSANETVPSQQPLPRLNLKQVFELRLELFSRLWKPFFVDNRIIGDQYQGMVAEATETLGKGIDPLVVAESTAYLLGAEADDRQFWELAWRLAGNRETLRSGLPVRPWSFQAEDQWWPVQIASSRFESRTFAGSKPRPGCLYQFQALAGPYCPGTISKWWSQPQYRLISRELGFTPPWGKFRLAHGTQLTGLRLWLLISAEKSAGRPGFQQVACSGSMQSYNRELLKVRCRQQPCPRGHLHDCHLCPVGYRGRDLCEFATHPFSYQIKPCPSCDQAETYHDPAETIGLCVGCAAKERARDAR